MKTGQTQVGETIFNPGWSPEEREKRKAFLDRVKADAENPKRERSPEIEATFNEWIEKDKPPRITYPHVLSNGDTEGSLYGAVYNYYTAMRADKSW